VNQQLALALHILGGLACRPGVAVTSDELAASFGTSPIVLRRVLSRLRKAGLVTTRRGPGGGSMLARDASTIRLREAFDALEESKQILRRHPASDGIGGVIGAYINEIYDDAEQALLNRLEATTVAQMNDVLAQRFFSAGLMQPKSGTD